MVVGDGASAGGRRTESCADAGRSGYSYVYWYLPPGWANPLPPGEVSTTYIYILVVCPSYVARVQVVDSVVVVVAGAGLVVVGTSTRYIR